jgi:ferric-dicitrate binding protein FerR (iron transport regulator)
MERKELSALLSKHVSGTINKNDFERLRTLLLTYDEQTIESCLYEVWQSYTSSSKRNIGVYEKVKENLKRIIRPEVQTVSFIEKKKDSRTVLNSVLRVAAMLTVPLMLSVGVYYFTKKATINELALNMYTIETSNGERTRLTLADGTRVMVSANTVFSYPAVFGEKSREVNLVGEAFFEVSHNAEKPFIVKSKEVSIKVLGTKFNVYAYPNEDFFEASLVEGKIQAFQNRNSYQNLVLKPNEKVRYHYASNTFEKSKTDLQVETAWTRGDLYFQSEDMHDILPKLERYYGVKFHIQGQLPNQSLTASYHETDINEILRNMAIHYHFSYTKKGETIYLNFQ